MAGRPVGEIVISLDLDPTAYTNAQKKILAGAKEATGSIDAQWRKLGGNTDAYYDAMAKSFMNSHQKIVNTGFQTTDTIVRSYQLMNVKLAALDKERYAAKSAALEAEKAAEKAAIEAREAPYKTLGIRSAALINQQIEDVKRAALSQQAIVSKGSQDWINIERAKNAKLKELNKEMVGEHELSMAGMMRTILRYYAAYYVLSSAIQYMIVPLQKGFKAVEEYSKSVASLAAMVVTFSEREKGQTLADQWREALQYSTAMIPVIEQIAARTLLSGQETTALANAFARSGVFLDANNSKQIEAFSRISNALPLMTQGQEIMRQINTEIRALMTGANTASSMMLQTLKAIDPQIKEHLETWRKEGTVLEHIGELLQGFGPATEILENQWQAVKTTIDTTATQILRGLMKPAYEEIIQLTRDLNKYLEENKTAILEWGKGVQERFQMIKDIMEKAAPFVKLFMGTPYKPETGPIWIDPHSVRPMPSPPKGIVPVDAELVKAREAAEKQITEAIRKNAYEREAIGKDAYEKDIIRINQEVEKYKEAGLSKVLIAKYVASETAIAKAKQADTELTEQIKIAKANQEYYDNAAKFLKELEIQITASAKKREEAEIHSWQKAGDAAVEALEKEIAAGMKLTKQSLDKPQKEADEARKMVTFYQDMIGMEDEYRQAKLDWIEKEAAVKFAGMDKELLKERWMKEQRIKFEQEIFDAKAKQIQRGLGDMSSMFQSLSGMYDKNSGEYARLQEAANAMIILQKAVAVVNAVSAVAAAAAAPFPAGFVAMASMAAAMGSLLGSIGLSIGGGGISAPSAAYGQGTTVLGGANGQGSESITKSWELLQDTYDMENTKLTGIYNEMKQLNDNITGIVRGIIQGDMGLMSVGGTGYSQSGMANLFNGILNTASDLATLASGVIIAGSAYMGVLAASAAAGPVGWAVMAALVVDKVLGLGIVDKVIGGISNFIFGSSNTTQTASGIMVGGGVVSPYTQTHTEKKGMFGGLFGGGGSSDSRTIYEANATLTNLFYGPNGIYTTLKSSVTSMATLLGADVAKAEAKVFEAFELNFIGKTADQIREIVSAKISEIGDKFAREVFGGLIDTYQQVGEGALETATRLAVDMVVVSDLIAMTGKSFSGTNEAIIALSESLIDLAGGLDKLSEAASTYYDKFFSDEEKHIRLQGILADVLSSMNLYLPATREGYRDLVEGLDLTTKSGQEAYVALLKASEYADQYYSTLEDVADAQDQVTQGLRDQRDTIAQWLSDMNRSTLAPSNSMEAVRVEYERLRGIASGSGATASDTSNFLGYAKEYLEYMKNYGGDYKSIYESVMADVGGLKNVKDIQIQLAEDQIQAIKDADNAARINAAALLAQQQAQKAADDAARNVATQDAADAAAAAAAAVSTFTMPSSQEINDMIFGKWEGNADGGYASKPTIYGEAGGEWAVPTYEPQRKNFLKKAPSAFWENLGLNGGSNGPGGDITVHAHFHIDGREIGDVVTKQIDRNGNLKEQIRRAAN